MPNGGDPQKCALARPFFNRIKLVLECFSAGHELEVFLWDRNLPLFIFQTSNYGNLDRAIQVAIEPLVGTEEAIVAVFINVFSKDRKRLKGWFVARGVLLRDFARVPSWLEAAHKIFLAVRDEDLVASTELANRLTPIFDTAGPLGERLYESI